MHPRSRRARSTPLVLFALLGLGGAALADGVVCGAPVGQARNPADLEHAESDLSLARAVDRPASITVCNMGYLAEKCGDHATALKIFDKCIAKGYVGALIWKGLMYEVGNGLPRDDAKAAEMFHQAAVSGEGGYAALGKLHYASALWQGKGVPKDEAEARRWFERAAQEGNEDAAEFLRTGHHTGSRDLTGQGVGTPTEAVQGQALVQQVDPLAPAQQWLRGLALAGVLVVLVALGAWQRSRATLATLGGVAP